MDSVTQGSDLAKMVYFDEAESVFYVSRNHAFHAQVRSFMAQSRTRNLHHAVEQVPMDVIQEKRSRCAHAANDQASEPSEMQRQASDLFRKAVALRASDIHIR